jgi:hypothetical protein
MPLQTGSIFAHTLFGVFTMDYFACIGQDALAQKRYCFAEDRGPLTAAGTTVVSYTGGGVDEVVIRS